MQFFVHEVACVCNLKEVKAQVCRGNYEGNKCTSVTLSSSYIESFGIRCGHLEVVCVATACFSNIQRLGKQRGGADKGELKGIR